MPNTANISLLETALFVTWGFLEVSFIHFVRINWKFFRDQATQIPTGALHYYCIYWFSFYVKGKIAEVVSVVNQAPRHEDVYGSEGIVPRSLVLCTGWRWVFSFTPRPPYLRKSFRYPSDRRLGVPENRYGTSKWNNLLLLGIKLRASSPYPVAVPTELSRLYVLCNDAFNNSDYAALNEIMICE
jgi:hypothetical protein